jgi:hypothetical protein
VTRLVDSFRELITPTSGLSLVADLLDSIENGRIATGPADGHPVDATVTCTATDYIRISHRPDVGRPAYAAPGS